MVATRPGGQLDRLAAVAPDPGPGRPRGRRGRRRPGVAALRDEAGLPLDPDDTGYGHPRQDVAAVRVSADLLDRYHAAVHAATSAYLDGLTVTELERVVDERWDPPVTAAVRLVSVIDDCAAAPRPGRLRPGSGRPPERGLGAPGGGEPMSTPTQPDFRAEHRFYGELAPWWPLISPPEEYAEEAAFAAGLLAADGSTTHGAGAGQRGRARGQSPGRPVPADPGGPVRADAAGVAGAQPDRRPPPGRHAHGPPGRAVRRRAHPRRHRLHDHRGRSAGSDRDGVRALRPGGIAVLVPDDVTENFEQRTEHGGSDAPDGRAAPLPGVVLGPRPGRHLDDHRATPSCCGTPTGRSRPLTTTHRLGLFPRDLWLRLLTEAGFTASAHNELPTGDDHPRTWFVGRRGEEPQP